MQLISAVAAELGAGIVRGAAGRADGTCGSGRSGSPGGFIFGTDAVDLGLSLTGGIVMCLGGCAEVQSLWRDLAALQPDAVVELADFFQFLTGQILFGTDLGGELAGLNGVGGFVTDVFCEIAQLVEKCRFYAPCIIEE